MTDDTTERVTVSTYLPAYQKAEWEADAESMDMSMSEFVRCMVQAGRRGFDLGEPEPDLETEVLDAIESVGGLTWREMAAALPGDSTEDELADVLETLQQADRVVVRPGGLYELAAPGEAVEREYPD